jgi:hypothetical protein
LLGTLIVLGGLFTWAVAEAQGPFGPGIRPPGGIGPGPFVPPQPPGFNPNPGNPFGQRPGFNPNPGNPFGPNQPGNPFGPNRPGFGPNPGLGPNFPDIKIPQIENVWKCSKCGQIVARGAGSHPPAQCPFCGTRLINGFGPANGPGVGGPVNPGLPFTPPGMPQVPPVAMNPPVNNPAPPAAAPPANDPAPNPVQPNNVPAEGNGNASPKSEEGGSTGTILLVGGIGGGVLALGLVGAGVVVMMNGKKKETERRARKRRLARALDD